MNKVITMSYSAGMQILEQGMVTNRAKCVKILKGPKLRV